MKKFNCILLLFSIFSINCFSQNCSDFLKWTDCRNSITKKYSIYLEPNNALMGVNDTLRYNIVFYDKMDYIITFCAYHLYYPLNIRLIQPDTGKELYDNADDDYIESLGIGFYNTQNLLIEVTLLAEKLGKDKLKCKDHVCVRMLLQNKKSLW